MIPLDSTDRKILNLLQLNGRISNAELAEQVHLSASACLRRVKRLEEDNVIDGYAMLVNQKAIGRPTVVFVEIALKSQSEETLQAFELAVQEHADIMECYLVSGDADYLLKVVASDTADYERVHKVLGRLPGIARTQSNFVLRTVAKKTAFEV